MDSNDSNYIKKCIRSHFDTESFVRFQQVLDFLDDKIYTSMYQTYNNKLLECLKTDVQNLPPNFDLNQYIQLKAKFYSFCFVKDVADYLISLMEMGNQKAEAKLIILCKILFNHVLTSKSDTANLALVELEQICVKRNMNLQSLYHSYRTKFLRLIIKAILMKLEPITDDQSNGIASTTTTASVVSSNSSDSRSNNPVILYMTRALEVFNIITITMNDVAQSLIITTNLIHKRISQQSIKIFLDYLASFQNIDTCTLIKTHIQAIIVSLLLRRKLSHFDMISSLNKLSSIGGKTLHELLATKFTFIKGRLILHYGLEPKSVTDGIYFLSKFEKKESDQPFEEELDDESSFIEYLKPSLTGILLGIDSHFTSTKQDLGSQESIKQIQSLNKFLSLLNSEDIEGIHVKLLSTLGLLVNLRPIRDNVDLNRAILDLWSIFVGKLSDSMRADLVVNICVALYDFIEDCPDDAATIYESLLLRGNPPTMKWSLKLLFFIPDIPQFSRIYKCISPEVDKTDTWTNINEVQESIVKVFPLLKTPNNKCRYLSLSRLKQLLQANQHILIQHMMAHLDQPLSQFMSKLIETLLWLCSNQDKENSGLIAECLGMLGAINPIRMDNLIYGQFEKKEEIVIDMLNPSFMVSLIEKLKNSLFSDQRSESEMASYALQVVLEKIPVFQDDRIKKRLSIEGLRACQTCQTTRYSGFKRIQPDLSSTTYEKMLGENNFSYKDWLDKFSLNLFSNLGDKKSENLRDVLYACSYVFRYNPKLAEFIIPHCVIYVIVRQPVHMVLVKREFLAIIQQDIGVSTQDLDKLRDGDNQEDNAQTLLVQCANIVFCTLDAVFRLECDTKKGEEATIRLNSTQAESLKEFINCLPKDRLGILAAKCRAYVRGLYYIDQYLYQYEHFNQYATILQKIYVALGDPFDAAGIEMVRTTPMTLLDDVSNYEAIGRFDKAFTCCITALDSTENGIDKGTLIDDSLRCLSFQGDFQRLYDKTKQLLIEEPQHKRNVLPYAIEASWKLNKWDKLDAYLENQPIEKILDNVPVGQGLLLNHTNKPKRDINPLLKIVRQNFIKPLSIAIIDRSAYFRGYENLLAIHSLGDFVYCHERLEEIGFDNQQLDENTYDHYRVKLDKTLDGIFETWNQRIKLIQPCLRSVEPVIEWQRSICSMISKKYDFLSSKINVHVGKLWLSSADTAREAHSFDRSFYCITQARRWFGTEFDRLSMELRVKYHIEKAKLDWAQGEQTKAIRHITHTLDKFKDHPLQRHLKNRAAMRLANLTSPGSNPSDCFPPLNDLAACRVCSSHAKSDKESLGQLKMLLTQYCEESASAIPETLFFMYEECVHLGVNQEETYFRLARYYDKLVSYYTENPSLCGDQAEERQAMADATQRFSQNLVTGSREEVITKLMEHSIMAFGNSLKHGSAHLRESMPRLLNIWYDLGSRGKKGAPRSITAKIENTIRFIDDLKNKCLPPYYFMTAISLILSRVAHPHSGVSKKTCEILEMLLYTYPHQITWLLIALTNDRISDSHDRFKAAKSILSAPGRAKTKKNIAKIVCDTVNFSALLIELCFHYSPRDPRPNVEKKRLSGKKVELKEISPRAALFKFSESKVLAPIQATIRAIIPMNVPNPGTDHDLIYPEHNMCYVRGFDEYVKVFNSLQQPRQVTLRCHNGRDVSIICKSGDDLRKDSRCVEFLNLLNSILRRDSQSNLRFMEIPTFLVLPLENEAGIIEMLPNCETMRAIVDPLYKERRGHDFVTHEQMPNAKKERVHYSANELAQKFEDDILPRMKPCVLPIWFLRRFNEPTSWYMARLAFTRSAAVTSMGGYIIGLGDRHLDNILVDTTSGRIVHVDFNLLFHQGELLQVPERVPFRLTHNLVSAFGPIGTEGNFRKVCEITMRVMRKEKDVMLVTLKPFLHDPCTEWIKNREYRNRLDNEDKHAENKTAKSRIEVIERKLKGYPRSMHFKPLTLIDSYSVEAQVDNLIAEATDNFNLAQMYFGWCPHV